MATSQRVIEIPEDEPFICPRCSSELAPAVTRKSSGRLRAVQIGAVVIFAAGLGAKIYLDNRPHPAASATGEPASAEKTAAVAPAMVAAAPPARVSVMPFLKITDANGAAARLAAAYLALSGDTDIRSQAGSQAGSTEFVGMQAGHPEAIAVTRATTPAARAALAHGEADLAIVSATSGEHALGTFAASVVVNPGNGLTSLTLAQLQGIFSGKIKNWSELGAPAGDIHAFIADPRGADNKAGLLFDGATAPAGATAAADDAAVLADVNNDSNAIGLVAGADAGAGHVVPVASDAGAALTAHLALAAPPGASPAATRFVAFAGSPAARFALEAAGIQPPQPVAEPPAPPSPAAAPAAPAIAAAPPVSALPASSDRFKHFVAGGTLLPIVFHFEPGSTALDRSGFRDVERLVAYLRAHHIGGDKLVLAGFSDNTGNPIVRENAAQKRVAAVVAALARDGITPARASGFGADVPVADDTTQEGRDRNRRVEVYVLS